MRTLFKLSVGCAVVFEVFHAPAQAACTSTNPGTNTAVTCSGTGVTAVNAQAGSTGVSINIDPNVTAALTRTPPVSFRVDTNSSITNGGNITLTGGGGTGGNRGAVMLGDNDGNQLLNDTTGRITTTGAYNDGMAADGNGNTLTNAGSISTSGPNAYGMTAAWGQVNVGKTNNTLINTGTVTTAGSNARAMSIVGGNGTIRNDGTISTSGTDATTAYMQGNNGSLVNTGTISATGANSDAVFSNTAGSTFTARIENRAGGVIFSQNAAAVRTLNGASTVINAGRLESGVGRAVSMGNGANTLILQTGSEIIGAADGGAGSSSSVILQGDGTASNAFTRFQNLRMEGGTWTFSGTGTFDNVLVQNGLLDLTGSFAPATVATIDAPATLQATAQNLPGTVVDNGVLRFNQANAGTYSGNISGSGLVQKTGTGTLTLAPVAAGGNTYSGGTFINQGVLAVSADNALGATSGGVTLDTGTLQFGNAFNLATSRTLTLAAGGGTLDTQANNTTITQGIGGAGALTKLGTGRLTLNGASTYTGATNLNAGTLVVGDATHAGASIGTAGTTPVTVASSAILGGYGTITGQVTNNGTLTVANATPGLTGSAAGTFTVAGGLQNNGLVQVAGAGVGNRLIVAGNYVGQNGRIALNTQVGADDSPTDKVVIRGGQASGSTTLAVTNVGGRGAETSGNGIELVQATGGATTTGTAFSLAAPVNAGAYTYYLARGGVTDGTAQGWYLRNNVAAPPLPPVPGTPPPDPDTPIVAPTPAPGSPALPEAPAAGSDPIPLYRPEVALYSAIPSVARQIGINQLDNFHDRQGDQRLLQGDGKFPASWGRAWGSKSIVSQNSAIDPKFDGSIFGAQAGQDLYSDERASGHRNHYGVFLGYARATGQVDGFSGGFYGTDVGHLAINSYSLGAYWTHVAPSGWYTDTVLMGSSLTIDPKSNLGGADSTHGKSIAASVETGLPIPLNDTVKLEPQAQLSWQRLSIKDIDDGAARVSFNRGNTYVGRVGVRLFADIDRSGIAWQPYVRLNVLRAFGSKDRTDFQDSATFTGSVGQTTGQVSAGVVARLTRSSSVYVSATYMDNLGGAQQRSIGGNAGVRWRW